MLFNSALISILLFASVVLANRHSEHRKSQLLRRAEKPTHHATQLEGVQYTTNWAGAAYDVSDGTFVAVSGTFIVPKVSGQSGAGGAVWVGIDGYTCTNATFQVGIEFIVGDDGPEYKAWYEWYPGEAGFFDDFSVSAGDVINVTVAAYTDTFGIATIYNVNTGRDMFHRASSEHALCRSNAAWIAEDFVQDGHQIPLANFGTVYFTDAKAFGPFGTATSARADILEIVQDNEVVVYTSLDGPAITIDHINPA